MMDANEPEEAAANEEEATDAEKVELREVDTTKGTIDLGPSRLIFGLICCCLAVAAAIFLAVYLSSSNGNNGSNNGGSGNLPTVGPSARSIETTQAPSPKPGRSFCCYDSTTSDPCNDCRDGDWEGFCAESLENCGSCDGTWCAHDRPTLGPSVGEGRPTIAPTLTERPSASFVPTRIASRNVFADSEAFYVNPTYAANLDLTIAMTEDARVVANLKTMKAVPSAYWIDVKSKIRGSSTSDLRGILLDAASKTTPPLCVFIVYNLPNRDCHAYASRGEICCAYNEDGTCDYDNSGDCADGLEEYKTEYIDPYVEVLAEFDRVVPMAVVIEPDSLPNFATNLDDPRCGNEGTQRAYAEGIAYAVESIASRTDNIAVYLDAAHGGWLGWESNLESFVASVKELGIERHLRGFATNVANYQGLGVPCDDGVDCRYVPDPSRYECCDDPCGLLDEYNAANNEHNYARQLVAAAKQAMPDWDPKVIIDTGRNGNPGARTDCATWCNPRDTLVGVWLGAETLDPAVVDAYYWLKTPGESDGCTETLPSPSDEFVAAQPCPRFDRGCAAVDSIGTRVDEPFCPEAGAWFHYQVQMLAGTEPLQ